MRECILIVLGVLSVIYGILVLQVGSGTSFWLIWEMIGIFFLFWALLLHIDFFASHNTLKLIFHTLVIVSTVVVVMFCGLIFGKFTAKGTSNLDYIIVLGAQVRTDGPSVVLKYRLDKAIDYLNENTDTICIVSGGKGINEPVSEAEAMAKYLVENGIEKKRIVLENQAGNTVENIRNSEKLMEAPYNGVGIVTNNFHVYRSVQIAKSQGIENICGIAADSTMLYLPNNILRECCGILKDRLLNNIRLL